MANRRTEQNYKREKVWNFLMDVREAVSMGLSCDETFSQICKRYRFGQISLPALRACDFIRTNGRGFKNWDWIKITPITKLDVDHFIAEIDRQKSLIPKKKPAQKADSRFISNLGNPKKPVSRRTHRNIDFMKFEYEKPLQDAFTKSAKSPSNLKSFQLGNNKKAVQAELPMHPARLTLLNKIHNEMLLIRRLLENIQDFVDEQGTIKTAER